MSDRVLEVKNLSVDIPLAEGVLHAVDGLNIHVDKGETLCIVGESGCGKSLTSLAIMDLLPKKAIRRLEQLDLGGTSILDYSERQMSDIRGNKMGMIFQEPMISLNPAFTIGNQMVETLHRHRNITGAAARDLAKHMLEKVGITAADQRLNQYPHQLSGGLRQRVMIAMTLLCEPELIIADEPTTALDVTIQAQILLLLQELQSEFDMGLILITHDLGVVAEVCDHVVVMYAGHVAENADVYSLFENPHHPYTISLFKSIPDLVGQGNRLFTIRGMVPSAYNFPEGCRFQDRCDFASETCKTQQPPLEEVAPDHFVACHHWKEAKAEHDAEKAQKGAQ